MQKRWIISLFILMGCAQWNGSNAQVRIGVSADYHGFQGTNSSLFINPLGYRVQGFLSKERFKFGVFFSQHNVSPRYDSIPAIVKGPDDKLVANSYHYYSNISLIQFGGLAHMYVKETRRISISGGLEVNYYQLTFDRRENYPGIWDTTRVGSTNSGIAFGPSILFHLRLSKKFALDAGVKQTFLASSDNWQRFANAHIGLSYKF